MTKQEKALLAASKVNHPAHYGDESDPTEPIKVIEAWGLGFCLGNAIKYIARAGKKKDEAALDDLQKAAWYLNRAIESEEPKHDTGRNLGIRLRQMQEET